MISAFRVEKKREENSKQLVSRFMKRFKKSGVLIQAKKSLRRKRPLSRKLRIKAALRREELALSYKKLEKLGKE